MNKNGAANAGARVVLGGKHQVCCVHDREKRVVTTDRRVAELGLLVGIVYDPRVHKIHRCGCCENLFFDITDEPRYCRACQGDNVHALGGPLAEPKGVVDG